ncbi:MAG: proton-conducting transporter membrane subunit, partial [Candidatus Omnitrophota bacterium]
MVILILLLPLIAFALIIFAGRRLPGKGSYISIFATAASLVISLIVIKEGRHQELVYNWFTTGTITLQLGYVIDRLSSVMLIVVAVISLLVQIYSIGYMRGDPRYSRYYAYLSLFTFSMLGIVLSNNFLQMFIFWELVGVCSYLLIGFWFEKKAAADAGKKAFITTKIGDFGFYAGILLIFSLTGSLNFNEIAAALAKGQV